MLNFVLGTSGTGKTKYLYDTFVKLVNDGDKNLMFIVPDQSSFATEKAFLEMLGPKLSQNIKVFGFSRLCDYVFEQSGNRFMSFADEGIRNMVMSIAVEQVGDKLDLFSKRAASTDLSELMLNCVKEYKKCSITPKMLYEASEKISDNTLSKKLYESALLYETYDAILSKSYIDPLDSLTHICSVIEKERLFENYTIAVDSFYGFTTAEYDVLSQLMMQCKNMYVALTSDDLNGANGDLFYVSERTKKRLTRIATQNGISVSKPVMLYDNHRFLSEELKSFDENIFRINCEKHEFCGNALSVYQAQSIYDEADYVARNIKRLVIEENYEYKDIAVITRNSDKYLGVLDTVFDKYDINYFMDKPQDIDTKPFIKFVMACFDVITGGFDKEDVLSLLKTDLTNITVEQISDFENYLFTWDITGKKLFDEFTLNPRGFVSEFTDSDIKLLSEIENTRKTVIDSLKSFYYDTKDTTALNISKALIKLIYRLNCKENLLALCDSLEKDGALDLCNEQIRIYNIFVEILDKMVLVIGDYSISAKRFSELLHINFLNTDISFIPKSVDQVDVACADRSLLTDKRAVFVIGAIDGEFPHMPVESGVFSDAERNLLNSYGLTMSDSIEQLIPTEKYLAYKALTSASEKLFISFYNFSLSGTRCLASVIVTMLPDIFENIPLFSADDNTIFDYLWCDRAAFDYYVRNYKSDNPDILKLKEYFSDNSNYSAIINAIDKELKRDKKKITDEKLAQKLFSTDLKLSASQVEVFHMCKFEYFCKYGLKVSERRQAKIDSLEYGTLMHFLLEEFIKNHKNDDFSQITESVIEAEVSSLLQQYANEHLGGVKDKTSRFLYLYFRIKTTATKILKRLCEEFAQSSFRPTDFELKIGEDIPCYNLKVSDDITVSIMGQVDRVDIMEHENKKYIRVIDYKTGTKKYCLSDVLYGINLQMLIYMSAINSGASEYFNSELTPAGVLYVPAVAPTLKLSSGVTVESAKKEAEKDSRMHGIILDDVDVITGMESKADGVYIPVSISGDKVSDRMGSLASLEEFGMLFAQVDKSIKQMALSLCDGDIDSHPAKGEYDACKWCPYISVCAYRDDDPCTQVKKYSKADVYNKLRAEEVNYDEKSMD